MPARGLAADHCVLLLADGGLAALDRFWQQAQRLGPRNRHWHVAWLVPEAPPHPSGCTPYHTVDGADDWRLAWQAQAWGLGLGFHRLALLPGRLTLTLCVGPTLSMLREQRFLADWVFLDSAFVARVSVSEPGPWVAKAMAQCCRAQAQVLTLTDAASSGVPHRWADALRAAGFAPDATDAARWCYHPHTPRHPRTPNAVHPIAPGHCAVIGAGLGGAAVAAQLAQRGWQVTVLDAAPQPAAGASGLPAGLVVAHISRDDCPLSRLSRIGVRLMLEQARQHLRQGLDWAPSGVLERRIGGTPHLPRPAQPGLSDWFEEAGAALRVSWGEGVWHHRGAWIRPAMLVRAWLDTPGVVFRGSSAVQALRQADTGAWDVLGPDEHVLCRANRVVLANAAHAWGLAYSARAASASAQAVTLPKMQVMRGLLSYAPMRSAPPLAWPAFPINGASSLIPGIPVGSDPVWMMGSTYQPADAPERSDTENHRLNREHLNTLLPTIGQALGPVFDGPQIQAWKGERCIPINRLPVIGPVHADADHGLWMCTGLGSRGLSFSALNAQWLAARWMGEPWPLPASLSRTLDSRR
ncbi:MAG: bifunctional tRNA (5-methylaminomethyl-2-thiouridine)(34)-methyltransferase MnmD/FAD-dependent 5-carboxymethylaminomethyl-2-thiouridine(34) oxidoreductase MnmC [Rhodoferax sp.]